jgi:transposase
MAEEKRTLFARLEAIENMYNGQAWHAGISQELSSWAGRLDTCLEAVEVNGKVEVRRKRNAIAQMTNRCGKMILLTSRNVSWKEALMTYRQRDEAEQDFGQLKDDIEIMPMGVGKMSTLRGLAFILFLSLQLRSLLLQRARKAKLLGKMWIEELLRILGMLKVTRIGQEWRLNEVTKKQRELCSALGVKALALPDLVTN